MWYKIKMNIILRSKFDKSILKLLKQLAREK
jgi:hypothetical protein